MNLWRPEPSTCGAIALAVIVLGSVQLRIASFSDPVCSARLKSPVLATELCCDHPIAASSGEVSQLRTATYVDNAFIVAYALLFVVCGRLYAVRGWRAVGAALAVLGLIAAAFDFAENRAIFRLLDGLPACPAHWSWRKWGFLFAALLVVSGLYLERHGPTLRRVLGVLAALAAGAAGLEGLVAVFSQMDLFLEVATRRLGAALLLGCLYFLLYGFLRDGLVAGLDRLAARPWLARLARWPER